MTGTDAERRQPENKSDQSDDMDSSNEDAERRQPENKSDQSDDMDSSNENYSSMVVALPGDITELILNKLDPVSFHCFGSVSRWLHSIMIAAKKRLKPQLPWIMYNSCLGSDELPKFFSLSGHGKLSRPKLVEASGIRCCGSSWGWLIMADGRMKNNNNKNNNIIFLLNPFTRIQIQLPTQAMIVANYSGKINKASVTIPPSHQIRKALLLSPPTPTTNLNDIDMDCVVVLINDYLDLYLCRLGDEEWCKIEETRFEDIILYQGQVYAITHSYELVRLDLEDPCPKVISCDIAPPPPDCEIFKDGQRWCRVMCRCRRGFSIADYAKTLYLVESLGGELLMVIRRWHTFCSHPDGFLKHEPCFLPRTYVLRVFKLDTKGQCWTKMENLLHQMLFVGSSNAIALSSLDFPNFTSGNCIYFMQQNFCPNRHTRTRIVPRAYQDTGVFYLEDKSIKQLFLDDDDDDGGGGGGGDITPQSLPIWFTPFSTSW